MAERAPSEISIRPTIAIIANISCDIAFPTSPGAKFDPQLQSDNVALLGSALVLKLLGKAVTGSHRHISHIYLLWSISIKQKYGNCICISILIFENDSVNQDSNHRNMLGHIVRFYLVSDLVNPAIAYGSKWNSMHNIRTNITMDIAKLIIDFCYHEIERN